MRVRELISHAVATSPVRDPSPYKDLYTLAYTGDGAFVVTVYLAPNFARDAVAAKLDAAMESVRVRSKPSDPIVLVGDFNVDVRKKSGWWSTCRPSTLCIVSLPPPTTRAPLPFTFETTGSTMAYLSYLLAKHQDIQDRLRDDVIAVLKRDGAFTYDNVFGIKYLDQVISESLRFYSPVVGFTTRRCARDYAHKGITIPAGTSIVIPNHHLSHDPNFWEQPEVFDPERFSPENKGHVDPVVYQPFGQGPRNCVGMRFAQLEMKLTMAKLLAKYKLLLDDRHIKENDLELESTFIFAMPKNGIWLKVEKVV